MKSKKTPQAQSPVVEKLSGVKTKKVEGVAPFGNYLAGAGIAFGFITGFFIAKVLGKESISASMKTGLAGALMGAVLAPLNMIVGDKIARRKQNPKVA